MTLLNNRESHTNKNRASNRPYTELAYVDEDDNNNNNRQKDVC